MTSEIKPGKPPATRARGGDGSAQSQGRGAQDAPAAAAASPLQRPRPPAALRPRADGPAPRPRSHFSTARGTRLRRASRASRLPAGRVGEQRCRRPRPGAQKRPHPSHLLTPAALRPPPPGSGQRGRRASCPAGRQTCNLPPRAAPQVVAGRSGSRRSGGGPSQTPNPGPRQARARVDLPAPPPPPHLPPPEPQPPGLLPGSAPPPPRLRRRLAGRGGKRCPGPRARAAALYLLSQAGAAPDLHCSARRSGAPEFGGGSSSHDCPYGHGSLLRVGASRKDR